MNIRNYNLKYQIGLSILACLLAHTTYAATSWNTTSTWTPTAPTQEGFSQKKIPDKKEFAQKISPFSPNSNNASFGLGQTFLMGDATKDFVDDIGFQVNYAHGVSDLFAFESGINYSKHQHTTDKTLSYSMLTLKAGMRMNLAWYDKVIPYISGGIGFYKPSQVITYNVKPGEITGTSVLTKYETVSPISLGLHIGPGVNLELTPQLFFGASLEFNNMFTASVYNSANTLVNVTGTFFQIATQVGMTF